jgi:hypothetical protein
MANFVGGLPGGDHATSGISIRSVDGANIDGVVISNVTMRNACCPIFIRLGSRLRDRAPAPGSITNVLISNVIADNASWPCAIVGIPGCYPENITLSNIRVTYAAGGPLAARQSPVPEQGKQYPTANMFGTLPAYGLYCRHVKNLALSQVQLLCSDQFTRLPLTGKRRNSYPYWQTPHTKLERTTTDNPGTALVAEDVLGFDIDSLQAQAGAKTDPVLQFINVRDVFVHGCRAPAKTYVYLELRGKATDGIRFEANDMDQARKAIRRLRR